ncbi:hypothetical protein WKV44_03865 [Spirochaetia bacterium 38H-sp]|uniref:Uncharacterized protein n=1 Tax=Rarispira pelagica TaxID=3141764 RepID=A0ABU9UAH8_9SPIR
MLYRVMWTFNRGLYESWYRVGDIKDDDKIRTVPLPLFEKEKIEWEKKGKTVEPAGLWIYEWEVKTIKEEYRDEYVDRWIGFRYWRPEIGKFELAISDDTNPIMLVGSMIDVLEKTGRKYLSAEREMKSWWYASMTGKYEEFEDA